MLAPFSRRPFAAIALLPLLLTSVRAATSTLHSVVVPKLAASDLTITQAAVPTRTFSVVGERGAVLGFQNGEFEAWSFPVKLLRNFRLMVELDGYGVPIELNPFASSVQVSPSETVITYSHAACTVRQHMLAPRGAATDVGAVVAFEIDAVRDARLTFRFTPTVERMWPAPSAGVPSAEWVANGGYYKLHTDDASLTAAVAISGARAGVLVPYQERAQTRPLEFVLDYKAKRDAGRWFPLLLTVGREGDDFGARLAALNDAVPTIWSATRAHYQSFLDRTVDIVTPDAALNVALRWAEVATEQARVRYGNEMGMTAGFAPSGDSARPGFGWFFGRDTLWSLYAVHQYGDYAAARAAFEFLFARQRADGKIMHEFSQAAHFTDWKATPYFYAAADAAPLLVMALEDYVQASGDVAFLRAHWEQVKRAYAFTRAQDSDGDGIMENTAGTGWVESWPGAMPHQELYLAALDQQSAESMSRLAARMNDATLAREAAGVAARIAKAIHATYRAPGDAHYAFSRNADGTLDRTASVYPAVAWWSGRFALREALPMFELWASHTVSTDWGTRDIASTTPFYDPISYHQGTVWPLFTAWVALAEYRAGQPLAGYVHLRQNAALTYLQDLGGVTELLSGDLFEPLGRSSTHQTWSSAMTFAVALCGLYGVDIDAPNKRLRLHPQLPSTWAHAALRRLRIGDAMFDVELRREANALVARVTSSKPEVLCLDTHAAARNETPCTAAATTSREVRFTLPAVELTVEQTLPLQGARTALLKPLSLVEDATHATLRVEALAGTVHCLPVRFNRVGVTVKGAELVDGAVRIQMPAGDGYVTAQVEFEWR